MTTMKAAVVPGLGGRVEIRELPVPEPGSGQVLVRMEASGLCDTDIHAAAGDWPVKPAPPFTPGHEGVGIIEKAGPGAGLHKPGDRVAIAWLGSACGHCPYCISGWETLCESQQNSGYSADGAWAEPLPYLPASWGCGGRARLMAFAAGSRLLGLRGGGCQPVVLDGLLDAPHGGGADALVDRECLLQVGGGLAGVLVLQVAVAESFQGACFFGGRAEVAGDGQGSGMVLAGLGGVCGPGRQLAEAV